MAKKPKLVDVTHGRFTVQVPEGWRDETTITFVAPPKQGLAAPLSGKAASSFVSNLNVTVEKMPEGIDGARGFLSAMGDALRDAGADITDVSVEDFRMGGRPAALAERKVRLGGQAVRQLTAAMIIDDSVVVASAATSESAASKERGTLVNMLENLRFG